MECNKEEAIRAKEIAEKRMAAADFAGAHKIARKAQQLYPGLDNVAQLLTVCEVHLAARNKIGIGGTETNWYSVLQIDSKVDEVTIKKQYRKLALLLHPDKNKFPGAEAAFKLIGEANRLLSDTAKRSVFDFKCRGQGQSQVKSFAPKPQAQPSQRNTFDKQQASAGRTNNSSHSQFGAANNVPRPAYMPVPGAYPSQNANTTALLWTYCGNCTLRFQFSRSLINQMIRCPSCAHQFLACDLGFAGAPPPVHSWTHLPRRNGIPTPTFQNGFPNSGPSKVPSQSNRGKPPMTQVKVDLQMNAKESVRSNKANAGHRKESVGKAKQNGGKTGEFGTSRSSERKRRRKPDSESRASFETSNFDEDGDLEVHNIGTNAGHPTRKSSRKKQNVSYKENKNEEDIVSPDKSKPSTIDEEEVGGASARNDKADVVQPSLDYPDPEFYDFDVNKAENCFSANQVWAIYDTCDGMPRFYARIKKVFTPFKLQMNWLEADPEDESENQWCNAELPVACGKYINGGNEETEDRLMFSHQVKSTKGPGRGSYLIYPGKGEAWALYKDWDIKWNSDPEKHKPPYRYEFVEVLADFHQEDGIKVAYLGKVKGFVSVFERITINGQYVTSYIAPRDLYRFSHHIPSYPLQGTEKDGLPKGSFELDTAALPTNLDAESSSFFPSSYMSHTKEPLRCGMSSIPRNIVDGLLRVNSERENQSQVHDRKKDETNVGNDAQPANDITKTPKKENVVEVENMQRRKSPRDLTKKNNSKVSSLHPIELDKSKHSDTKSGNHSSMPLNKEIASASVADGNTHFPVRDGSSTSFMDISAPTPAGTSGKISGGEMHDFKEDKSEGKFKVDQIWAIYCDGDRMPKSYAQIKFIESVPDFRLHVQLLEACSPPDAATGSVCCGTFKPKNFSQMVLQRPAFSHEVKAKTSVRNRFEIYPQKGELWAMYKNPNPTADKSECDVVEVLEDDDQYIKVIALARVNGIRTLYRDPRTQIAKTGFLEIPKADVSRRFSHQIPACFSRQIPACYLTGEKDAQSKGCWYADPLAIPCSVICLE